MTFPDEEHGFSLEANRFKLYRAIDAFLGKNNPAGRLNGAALHEKETAQAATE